MSLERLPDSRDQRSFVGDLSVPIPFAKTSARPVLIASSCFAINEGAARYNKDANNINYANNYGIRTSLRYRRMYLCSCWQQIYLGNESGFVNVQKDRYCIDFFHQCRKTNQHFLKCFRSIKTQQRCGCLPKTVYSFGYQRNIITSC